jgi:hypothetical protein
MGQMGFADRLRLASCTSQSSCSWTNRPQALTLRHVYLNNNLETKEAVANLQRAGYNIYWVSNGGHEYGFIRS